MRAQTVRFLAILFLFVSCSFAASPLVAAEADPALMQADHQFVQAVGKGDAAGLGKIVDAEFTWTDVDGKTLTGEEVLRAVPKEALGDERGVEVSERTYGQVGAGKAGRGKVTGFR